MKILAFFAHPDDETMLAGGTLALLAQAGAQTDYVCATRGEGGEIGEPQVCELSDLGQVRTEELHCAVRVLGGKSVSFLDYIDPRIGPGDQLFAYTENIDQVARRLISEINKLEPDFVITHGSSGEYGHPAHIISYQAAMRAIHSLNGHAPALYCVSAAFPEHPKPRHINHDQPAHLVLDISPVIDQKIQAALCHRTQNALFVRRSSERAGRQLSVSDVIQPMESLHRALPAVDGHFTDPLSALIKSWLQKYA